MRGTVTAGIALAMTAAAALADPTAMVLRDGFEGADFAADGGLYYRENAEQAAGTVTFQPEVVRNGQGALKLSVVSLCKPTDDGCSERAEIWERTALRVPYDRGVWYGFSVRFGDPIPQDDHRYLIAQWKREIGPEAEGDFSPYLAFRMTRGKLFITVETNHAPPSVPPGTGIAACPEGQTPAWLRPETNQMRLLVAAAPGFSEADDPRFTACTDRTLHVTYGNPLPAPGDGWIDFAIWSLPGPDGTGHLEVFANGKRIVTVKGNVGHNDKGLGQNQYFKFGPYRDGAPDPWTLFYDDFVRSPDCMDVLADAALCAAVAGQG
ncbi:MAG: polysaccharide lyase [Paracoccaceae bacterium]|nr:MAG: polysaccharide lyase [Paracoccaceae bacterium]